MCSFWIIPKTIFYPNIANRKQNVTVLVLGLKT